MRVAFIAGLVLGGFLAACADEPAPSSDGGAGGATCQSASPARQCHDDQKSEVCNRDGFLNAAICYDAPGPNPLPQIESKRYPSYGCIAPTDRNSGEGDAWTFWCCSKLTPGPVDDGCGGTCANAACLPSDGSGGGAP